MSEAQALDPQDPLPALGAWWAVARSVVVTAALVAGRRVHQPGDRLGMPLRFGDGTSARVYRETLIERTSPAEPCVLVIEFRLRGVRGRGHALFRVESVLNTPLFAGFPGLVSKLWLTHDQRATYRGLYEWDGADSARTYARSLWRVLALVSVPGSIHYRVLPGITRDALLDAAHASEAGKDADDWWRPVGVAG